MAGLFDDLIPADAGAGTPAVATNPFADLIPQQQAVPVAPAPQPSLPAKYTDNPLTKSRLENAASMVTDIPGNIAQQFTSGVSAANAGLNPFSQANQDLTAQAQNAPWYDLRPEIQRTLNVGKGILGIPQAAASWLTGTGEAVLGGGLDAISPRYTPQQLQRADQMGVMPISGKDAADLAMSGARPAGYGPIGPTSMVKAPAPTTQQIRTQAGNLYDAAKATGVEWKSDVLKGYSVNARQLLNNDYGIDEILAPKTMAVLDKLENPAPGSTVTVNNLRSLQRKLGLLAGSPDNTERMAASISLDMLNGTRFNPADMAKGTAASANRAADLIQEANANYSAFKKANDFDFRQQKALDMAGGANSGLNIENKLRQQVRQILTNPKLQRGYSPETLAAFREFNRGSRAANVLRYVSNVLSGGGGIGVSVIGSAGAYLGGLMGPEAAAIGATAGPLAGVAGRMAANANAARKFGRLGEMLRNASPLAQSLPPVAPPLPSPIWRGLPFGLRPNIAGLLGPIPSPADNQQR